jgi:hypothetical protein
MTCSPPGPDTDLAQGGHYVVTEATIAYSGRPGFAVARWMSTLLKPGIRRTARRFVD